ncbi:hypothetical protein [Streptomyces longispororuber]|uniref:hypothetical protein n=1 Tax=Streptomyces longispororuber TaxID=68230 RepID=UPI00210DD58F|nr:hypothetical protein [Streptomyces longispororuber]MCQ4208961.1 hypothetical protein [Streptomyces longispororuber]
MSSTPDSGTSTDLAACDWAAWRGRRVVLDDRRTGDDDSPGCGTQYQGVVSDIDVGDTGAVELTLTRYDGSTRLLCPVGRFTVTDGDTGDVLYTPARPTAPRIPLEFIEAVRSVAPERWDDLERLMATMSDDGLPPREAEELVDTATHVEWECTRERDVLDDPTSPATSYAQAARHVVETWEATARPSRA